MRFNGLLLAGCALGIFASTAAVAQTAPQASAADSGAASGDIVVTARRIAERIQDVPIAVTAFSQGSLEAAGVRTVGDLALVTPGLNFTSTVGGGRNRPAYELRGIPITDVLSSQDQTIGLYVNDVYMARPVGSNSTLIDLENVQVLYGPQGTLFGRNTIAGAILINTKKPTKDLGAQVWAELGNYNARVFGGIVNLPLNDAVQLRLLGQRSTRDGTTKNIANGQDLDDEDNYSLRASLRVASGPFESVTVGDYFRTATNFNAGKMTQYLNSTLLYPLPGGGVIPIAPATFGVYPTTLPAAFDAAQALGPRTVAWSILQSSYVRTVGVSNTTSYELSPNITLKNIIGYRDSANTNVGDTDKTALDIAQNGPTFFFTHQFSEELQLQGKAFDNRLTWIMGGYYFRERTHEGSSGRNFIGTTSYLKSTLDWFATNTSKSLFAQGTFAATDKLNLTAGLRYNWDKRQLFINSPLLTENAAGVLNPPTCQLVKSTTPGQEFDPDGDCLEYRQGSFKALSYTTTIDYHLNKDLMVYVAHRRGYRSGGFNGRATNYTTARPFSPETVKDVEIGAKGEFAFSDEGRFNFDVAAFQMWYTDMQRSVIVLSPAGTATTTIFNAAKATIKGFEVKATIAPIRQLSLNVNWAHNIGKYNTFAGIRACPPGTAVCTSAARQIITVNDIPFGTARDNVNVNLTVTPVDTPELGKISATGSMNYRSKWFLQNEPPVFLMPVPARAVFNVSLEWKEIAGSRLSARAFVNNVFDKLYAEAGLATLNSLGFGENFYGDPRTFGLRLTYKFGGE